MKLPAMLRPIFDMAILFNSTLGSNNSSRNIEKWYYFLYEKLPTILLILSISGIILFYYLFDKNFKFGLKIAISKLTSSEKSHLEYLTALEKSRTKK